MSMQHFESAQTPGQQLTDDEPPRVYHYVHACIHSCNTINNVARVTYIPVVWIVYHCFSIAAFCRLILLEYCTGSVNFANYLCIWSW